MANILTFDENVFSKDAVLSTCYWCADKYVSEIVKKDGGWVVSLVGRNGSTVDEESIDEFRTMVVHNQLRHQLKEKFANLEASIIEKAFRPVKRSE